jgi:hypothetical protein
MGASGDHCKETSMNARQIGLLAAAMFGMAGSTLAQSRSETPANPQHPLWGIVSDVVRGVVDAKIRREQIPPNWQAPMEVPPASRIPGAPSDATPYPPARYPGQRLPGIVSSRAP